MRSLGSMEVQVLTGHKPTWLQKLTGNCLYLQSTSCWQPSNIDMCSNSLIGCCHMICHFYIPHTTVAKACTEGFEHKRIPISYSQTTTTRRILSITLLSDDSPHSMEEPSELWVGLGLVMNELDLDGLHGAHNHNGLRYPSPKTRQQRLGLCQLAFLICHLVL